MSGEENYSLILSFVVSLSNFVVFVLFLVKGGEGVGGGKGFFPNSVCLFFSL